MSLITHRTAGRDYDVLDTYTAGIELFGYEVKSLKGGHGSLEGSYVTTRGNEAYVIGMFIPPYQAGNTPADYDPYRNRKLLLTRQEIDELEQVEREKGLTIIPLSVYNKGGKIKVDIASVRGKKKFDKRESMKARDTDRAIRRELSDR